MMSIIWENINNSVKWLLSNLKINEYFLVIKYINLKKLFQKS